MTDFKKALSAYKKGESLTKQDLLMLLHHFDRLSDLVSMNPDLASLGLYANIHKVKIQDYMAAREENKG